MRHLVTLLAAGLVLGSCDRPSVDRLTEATAPIKTAHSFVTGSRLLKTDKAVPGRYIVVLDDKATAGAQVEPLAKQLASLHGASVERVYSRALQGFAAKMPEAAALRLSNDPRVRYVEEDAEVSLVNTQAGATWGLDRIDQREPPLDQTYYYGFTGSGVHAYVIDTGIRTTHAEFGGRAVLDFSAIDDGNGAFDCHGHGTHVAGTIGGATYGVAKAVTLHAVRVIDCSGQGTASSIIAGVDWVTANHMNPAVVNMSLGGPATQALDDAVTNSINAGVFYAVAAGNYSSNACALSPARAAAAVTVGATDITDTRAWFSNYGPCVDLFAPGQDITSAWNTGDTDTNIISGTSMATPHVVGAAALYLEGHPLATPAEVTTELLTRATPDKVINPGAGSPNQMLFAGCMGGPNQTPPQAILTAPSSGSTLSGPVTLAASATDDQEVARVEFFLDSHWIGTAATAPYELSWNSATANTGPGVLTARAYDASCNSGVSAPVGVTIQNASSAAFDATWGTPACAVVSNKCDSVWLLEGRGGLGPELHAPNTLGNSCADGAEGTYRTSPSLERLVVSRSDGTALAAGKEVTVQATVFASTAYAQEALDLYAAPNASAPTWTLLATLSPSASGRQTLSATYLLPASGTQAVRGVYRSGADNGSACVPGPLNDHDDLVFAVGQETDSTPPSVAITAPTEGATVMGVTVINMTASDNFGVQRVELYDGSTLVGMDDRAPYSVSWTTQPVPNGAHALTARAYDVAGNVAISSPVNVVVDNDHTPPQVSFVTPTDGATVSETVSIQASASDNLGVMHVDVFVDGTLVGSAAYEPYTVSWSTRSVSNGPHVLTVTAQDAAGNTSPPSSISVTVDNDLFPPETTLTSPANGATLSGTVSMTATASDDRQVARVDFLLNGGLIATDTTAPYAASWDSTQFANGSYALSSRAYDGANQSTTSAPITVEVSNPGNARYDPVLHAPRCDTLAARCDTRNLVQGRGWSRPEDNMPNTLDGCLDGSFGGGYHFHESIERIRVIREDGKPLAAGGRVRIEVDVWAYTNGYTADSLDLYYAADATQPSWTYITTLRPSRPDAQTLSAYYTLPAGTLQAVRANFRWWGSPSPCSPGDFDDRDDVVFPVFVDTVPPTVTLDSPVQGATVSGTALLRASASDNYSVTAVDFYDGQTLLGTDTSSPYSLSWDSRSVPNGTHTLTARARDEAGLVGTSQVVTVTVDNDFTAPEVSITAPAPGATIVGPVTISASATDNKLVSRVDFYDGIRWLGSDTSAPYSYAWNTLNEQTGDHVLTAKAYDPTGNVGTSEQVVVTVARDTTPPSVSVTNPTAGTTLTGTVTFSATATDDASVTQVELLLDGNVLATRTAAPYSFSWNTRTSANGIHTLSARATDTSGNVGTSAGVGVTLDNDLTAPTVSITSLTNGATVTDDPNVEVSATDNVGVTQVSFFVDGLAWGTDSTAPYVFPWNTKSFSNGVHTLTAKATDAAGNVGTTAITVTVDNDYTPPTVSITSPASGTTVQGQVSFEANATDNKGVTVVGFYVNGMPIATDTTAPYNTTWNADLEGNGTYTLTAKAYDAVNNSSTSAPVTVTINQPGRATFDSVLHAPKCTSVNNFCDTMNLVTGRGYSFEKNAPNTLDGCSEVNGIVYSYLEQINRIKVSRVNGALLEQYRPARIDVDVVVYSTSLDALDLFYTSDATHPSWTYLTTLRSSTAGAQTLSTEYVLPAGSLQAVRAQFRKSGSSSTPCSTGTYDDHDDVAFAVGQPPDLTPPTVEITAPSSNALVKGVVPVAATASDDVAVARVELYVDGALIGTDTSAPYEASWNSISAADGAHTLTAKAYDYAGRVGTSSAIVVYTDVTPPDAALTSPAPGTFVRGSVVLQATASDNQAVSKVEFYDGPTLIGTSTTVPYSVSWNTLATAEGAHTLTVKAFDSSDNVRTSSGVAVTVDNTAPSTALSAPAQNTWLHGTVQVSATASDNQAIARVELYAGATLIGTTTTAPYTVSWDTTTAPNGSITLTARAYDAAGNVTPSAGVTVSLDNSAPTVAITAPANGASLFLSTTLQASAGDNVGVTQVVFYDGATVIGTDTTAPYSVSWSLLVVSKGWHTVTAKAYDAVGNVTTSAPISVKVN